MPHAFLCRAERQLGDEYSDFLKAMALPPVRGLRKNRFRTENDYGVESGNRIPWVKDGYELLSDSRAGISVPHEAGAFYLQDPSAMIPASVLAAQPGEAILDLCAAPGGKSTQVGLDMEGKGLLVCNEPVPGRAAVLSRNIERLGIPNSIVTCAYPEELALRWPEGFDGVLADVPCSGEGMFRRHPESRAQWTEEEAAGCARRQKDILKQAAKMVRPGGRLVYATCTWNPAENENQITSFLDEHPGFEMEAFSLPGIGVTPGYFACWPHRIRGEGQFTALLRKRGNGTARRAPGDFFFRPDPALMQIWKNSGLGTEVPNAALGQTLVRLDDIPDLRGIRVLRLGLHIGQCRGKVFLPDHAAALAIKRPALPEMELTDADALRYLAGEAIEGSARGWTVMTWKGLSLGWGKGSDGAIRNHYPKGLRNGKLICCF